MSDRLKCPFERGSEEWIDQIEKEHYVLSKMQMHTSFLVSAFNSLKADLDEFEDIRVKPISVNDFFE